MINYNEQETELVKEEMEKCENIGELRKKISSMLYAQEVQWQIKINEILDGANCTQAEFAKLCNVSRVSVNKWCKGAIPKSRDTFIRIGLAAKYSIEQMNRLLTRYGRYGELYSKTLEDSICIFVINNKFENYIETFDEILNRVKEKTFNLENKESEDIQTIDFNLKLSQVETANEMEKFIDDNIITMSRAFHRLYAYIMNYYQTNYEESVNSMANGQEWSTSLVQCYSAIRQKKWYPTRNKIISLGIHFNMTHEEIDTMLEYAHMTPLYAKNIFESIIIFILEDAILNNMLDPNDENYNSDNLLDYARTVLEELDIPEVKSFLSEVSEKTI